MSYRLVLLAVAMLSCIGINYRLLASADIPQRPYRFDDASQIEGRPDSPTFSPDGVGLAFTRARPLSALPPHAQTTLAARMESDIWLQVASGRKPRNLTNGQSDGSGSWGPQWSPDSRHLAFLSTRSDKVGVWLWDRVTDRVRSLSSESVVHETSEAAFRWIDAERILCFGPPEGEVMRPLSREGLTVEHATQAWAKAARGELTASALDSRTFPLLPRRLFVVDVATGASRTIGQTAGLWYGSTALFRSWWSAPRGQVVAFVRPVPAVHGIFAQARMGWPRTLELRTMDGQAVRLARALPDNILSSTLTWSHDGQELAFFAYGEAPVNLAVLYGRSAAAAMPDYEERVPIENPARLWRVNVSSGRVDQISTEEIDVGALGAPSFVWTGTGELLIRTSRRRAGTMNLSRVSRTEYKVITDAAVAREWYVLNGDGRTRLLTSEIADLPEALPLVDDGQAVLAVSQRDLWRIDVATGKAKNLTAGFAPAIVALRPFMPNEARTPRVVLSAQIEGETVRDYILDLASGHATLVTPPAENAAIVAFVSSSQDLVYVASDRTGTFLWRARPSGQAEVLVQSNTFLRGIAKGKVRVFNFTNSHGQTLKGVLHLPLAYQVGRRYPLVAFVYLGRSLGASAGNPLAPPGNLDALSAAGYASLELEAPGNPPGLDGEATQSMFMVSSSVLPAVDSTIAMGVADPDRLFAYGHSNGGWSVAGLLVQTTRFKAAVGLAGAYDRLVSCGSLMRNMLFRYTPIPHGWVGPTSSCARQPPTDVPWWRELAEIRANEPLTHVERIQTPFMLVHGDLDPVGLESAETLFNALVSLRRRSQLVRYWGESHNLQTPANIRDSWQRMFAWFEEFGDIARDAEGNMMFEGDRVQSRKGAPALTPADFSRFGPAAPAPIEPDTSSR